MSESSKKNDGQRAQPRKQAITNIVVHPSHEENMQLIGYKRMCTKETTLPGKSPSDVNSNDGVPDDDVEANDTTQDFKPKPKHKKTTENEGRRNRASPTRLFKVGKDLVQPQKDVIIGIEFGGLLDISTSSMPGDFSQWVMKHYYPEMSQLVIPERGKIQEDASSVQRIWGLPNKGTKVCYENREDYTSQMNAIFNINGKGSPSVTTWCKMIKDMAGAADDNFMRAWFAVAFLCFLAPTTCLNISPRCYPAVMHVDAITVTNVRQFVVDQLKLAFAGAGDKNAVCCCVMHLVVSLTCLFSLIILL